MRPSNAGALVAFMLFSLSPIASVACRRQAAVPPPAAVPQPPVSGTLALEGLRAPVRVVRDRWGVPHISAGNETDLFFAQGFVQAEDRLFQMDLWRRSVQGRLAEVLGANFIERDAMTRRVQYRGDLDREWASYGPGTRAIATAFTGGINAWVAIARGRPPEEFALAGWLPELWQPEDLLNRTDGFVASVGAGDELLRARLVTALGAARLDSLFHIGDRTTPRTVVPVGAGLDAIADSAGEPLRRVGTPPFFSGLAAPVRSSEARGVGSNAWAVGPRRSTTGAPLLAGDPHRPLEVPSSRYLVHLTAPGWNVSGATAPWLPGVAIGHNERVAWSMTADDVDTEDVYVERLNPADPHQVQEGGRWIDMTIERDAVYVKGRPAPFEFERQYTRRGVVFAVDRERHLAYTLRWSGAEPGAAAELGALGLDRARSWTEFREALGRWKMPAAEFVYADADGRIARQVAARSPLRSGWDGRLPIPGWTGGSYEWTGWATLDDLRHAVDTPDGYVASANDSRARLARIDEALSAGRVGPDDFRRMQLDTLAWNAAQLVPLLSRIRADRNDVEAARQELLRWDARMDATSPAAALYAGWEAALAVSLARQRIPPALLDDFAAPAAALLVPSLVRPSRAWFDGDVEQARDALVLGSLTIAVEQARARSGGAAGGVTWGSVHAAAFAHPLSVTERARARFAVGPFAMGGYRETLLSLTTGPSRAIGPSLRLILNIADWDGSLAMNAPGQGGSPDSPHYRDLASLWTEGSYVPLWFTDRAVQANAETTLALLPK